MNIFEEVKELVNVPTVARHYGIKVSRSNMAVCPFHDEKTASMKLYEKNYHCFGCQAHGDAIQLVQELFNIKPVEAVKRINSDFGLGLDLEKPPDMQEVNRRRQELERQKAEQQNRERIHNILLSYFALLDKYKIRYAPKNLDTEPDERYVYAIHHIEYAWYLLETFNHTDTEEQEEIKLEADQIEKEYKKCIKEWGEW